MAVVCVALSALVIFSCTVLVYCQDSLQVSSRALCAAQYTLPVMSVRFLHGHVLFCRSRGCRVHATVKPRHTFKPVLHDSAYVCPCAGLQHISNTTISAATFAVLSVHTSSQHHSMHQPGVFPGLCKEPTCCLLHQCLIMPARLLSTQLVVKASHAIS
jgi:hypothetical protein